MKIKHLKMKLSVFLTFFCVIQITAATGFGQEKINIDVKNASLDEILEEIKVQTDYRFFFEKGVINLSRKMSLKVRNETVENVLGEMFRDSPISFTILKDQIVFTRKPPERLQTLEPAKGLSPSPLQQVMPSVIVNRLLTVTGTVTDRNGNPLIGVNIQVKGTTRGTVTDFDGGYSIDAGEDDVLIFSYVGYQVQELGVNGQTEINVQMTEDAETLDELVVVGYGVQKKSDLTGAVASIEGDQIAKRGQVNVSQALQGTIPGLLINRSGGSAADASASIRIRGVTTIGNSNPLIILDGIPVRSLDWINPNDIESISVLKDASSSALYGSRAAAGVIIVTTKTAKSGQISLTYNYQNTIEQPTRVAEYAGVIDYMRVLNEITWNDNNNLEGAEHPVFSKELIDNYDQLYKSNSDEYPVTDWTDLMLNEMAVSEKHGLSLTAGGDKIKSFISLNYDNTNALYDGRNFDRITLKTNNNIFISDQLSLDLNLNALYSLRNRPRFDLTPGPVAGTIYAAEWEDGRIAGGKDGDNPYALFKYGGYFNEKSNVLGGQLKITYRPIDQLRFSAVLSPQLDNTKVKFFRKKISYTAFDDPLKVVGQINDANSALFRETSLDESRFDNLSTMVQLFSDYSMISGKHSSNITLGFEESYSFSETLGAFRDRYILSEFPYLDNGNENFQFNDGSAYEFALRSFFGRLSYDYQSKYLVQANVRYDGSSRFAKEYRWGWFPSVSTGWILTGEDFMRSVRQVDFLKLRASWGSLGNERIGNYPYQSTLSFGSVPLYRGSEVVSVQTIGLSDYAIYNISWETTEVFDFGIDAYFLNNKLTLNADYFVKNTRDMLLALEIPNFLGVSNPQQNAGAMQTKGWEIAVGWNGHIGAASYSVNGHLSDMRSVMGDMGGTEFLGDRVKFEGSEFDEWYGYKSDGIFQSTEEVGNSAVLNSSVKPGDIKYLDISGPDGVPDGTISPEYDRVLLGGSLPRFLYGGNLNLSYKNFDLGMVFQGIGKQNTVITNSMVQPIRSPRPSLEVAEIVIDNYWSQYNSAEENLNVQYPRVGTIARNNNNVHSDFWMFNGGYFRLKNLAMGYSISGQWMSGLGVESIHLNLTGTDLFSIDRFPKGWDPETSSTYWVTRAFVLGVSVQF